MFFTIGWSVFVHAVQLYTKRVSCAVPLRIVTIKATGELTASQPAVINIIPDQVPLIQGRRQQTPHPPPTPPIQIKPDVRQHNTRPLLTQRPAGFAPNQPNQGPNKGPREGSQESDEGSLEFPNRYDYEGYYYNRDYYKYYPSYYVDNGNVGFQFRHPRYPYGHTVFAEALVMKQIPFVFKEVFLPTAVKIRASSIVVDEFFTQAVPFEIFKKQRPGHINRRSLNQKTPIIKPQTHHEIRRENNPKESINSMNFKSILEYYTYNEEKKGTSKYSSSKRNIYNADKSSDNKNFNSVLSYAYNEDGDDRSKYDSIKKERPTTEKRMELSKFRRQLQPVRITPSTKDAALQTLWPPELMSLNHPVTFPLYLPEPPDLGPVDPGKIRRMRPLTTRLPVNGRRRAGRIDSHEGRILEKDERKFPFELNMPRAAEMAIAPAISFFDKLIRG